MMSKAGSSPLDVDRGWAWMVMLGSICAQFLVGFLLYGAGVMHVALLEEFQESVAATSLIGSVFTSTMCLCGPFASVLIHTRSCRVAVMCGGFLVAVGLSSSFFLYELDYFILTYGILAGSGLCLCVVSSTVVVAYSFNKYRGIVVGFNIAGAGVGMFASGPVAQALLDIYGIRGTFLVLGGICSNFILFGALLKPSSIELSQNENKEVSNNDVRHNTFNTFKWLLTDATFVCILLSDILWNVSYSMMLIHLPNYAHVNGADHHQAALLLTMIGLGSTLNRVLTGITQGPGGIDPLLIYMGFLGVTGLLTLTFPLYSSRYSGQLIFSFLFGIYSGALIALINPLCVELVGLRRLPTAVGITYLICGFGYMIGPPVAGIIVDNGGSYEEGFCLSGACFMGSSFLCLVSSLYRKKVDDDPMTTATALEKSRFLSGSSAIAVSMSIIIPNEVETTSIGAFEDADERARSGSSLSHRYRSVPTTSCSDDV